MKADEHDNDEKKQGNGLEDLTTGKNIADLGAPAESCESIDPLAKDAVDSVVSSKSSSFDGISGFRGFLLLSQRIMALGFLSLIGASLLDWIITLRIIMPLAQRHGALFQEGISARLIGAFTGQFGLILLLPFFAWCFAWLVREAPYRLCIGAALLAEVFHLLIKIMSQGGIAIYGDPVFVLARLFFMLLAGLLGGLAYSHARHLIDRQRR